MKPDLKEYYKEMKSKLIKECIQCGLCISKCPVLKHTEINTLNSKLVQRDIINFLKTGEKKESVFIKAHSCMECFHCVGKDCPKGFDSLLINEIIKSEYQENMETDPVDNKKENDDYKVQRVLASLQTSKEEQERIFTESKKQYAKYVFFPGCNIYKQPEKILMALDILDKISEDYAYVPGLDNCCGDLYVYGGKLEKASKVSRNLIDKISLYSPEKVILWCPTCSCRFENALGKIDDLPFEFITFSQFVAENIDKLEFLKEINKTVTLHEPCKTAYMGIDLMGVRKILSKIPNIKLSEMEHHGNNTLCCGSGAITYFPNAFKEIRDLRLKEAEETNADILVDVCHFCHETFVGEESKYKFTIENYIHLLAEAIGIGREDKFKEYIQLKDRDKILEDAKEYVENSSYTESEIINALNSLY